LKSPRYLKINSISSNSFVFIIAASCPAKTFEYPSYISISHFCLPYTMAASKIVLITGANTGIGLEAIKALLSSPKPYTILMGARTPSKAEGAIAALKTSHPSTISTVTPVTIDVASDASIESCFKEVSSKHPRVDVLINNAGASFDMEARRGEITVREAWNKTWDVNVSGTHVMTHTFCPLLIKSSDPRLIFLTSGTSPLSDTFDTTIRLNQSPQAGWPKDAPGMALFPGPTASSYRAAKTGMNMMMREWVRLLRNDGVKIWAVSPGFLATGLGGMPEALKKMGAGEPRLGGEFLRKVVEGERDADVGLSIRAHEVQPW